MNEKKTVLAVVIFFVVIFMTCVDCIIAVDPPPVLPNRFYGTVKNIGGDNIRDGAPVRAMVIDAHDGSKTNFTTTVSNGQYNLDQIVSEGGHDGDAIWFFIDDINTSQSGTYRPGGNTQFNLIHGDTTPPVLSAISAGSITTSSAVITWTTDESANSTVQYGLTTSYGSTASNALFVTSPHSVPLSSLTAGTTYHYRVRSYDQVGNVNTSSDFTFNTASESSGPGPGPGPGGNEAPTAQANGPYSGTINQNITFNATGSTDDSAVVGYRWDWTSDGTYDTAWITTVTTTHAYTTGGTFTVTLQVKDAQGETDTDTATATITSSQPGAQAPVADAGGPYIGLTFENITFDGTGSTDDESITNYTWNFGDGFSGYGVHPVHSYNLSGVFNVTLTVLDNDGLTDIDTTTATIMLDTDADGWTDTEETLYGTDPNNSTDYPLDTDDDHSPDSVDVDDDNDGLTDELEQQLGTDPTNSKDVESITIQTATYYLLDTNGDGYFDALYNPLMQKTSVISIQGNLMYLDVDGDEKYDFIYDSASGEATPYQSGEGFAPWLIAILTGLVVILIIVVILVVLFKRGYLYLQDVPVKKTKEKQPEEKKEQKNDKKKE